LIVSVMISKTALMVFFRLPRIQEALWLTWMGWNVVIMGLILAVLPVRLNFISNSVRVKLHPACCRLRIAMCMAQ